ncbi:MAG: transcription antitermination protein NusB [Muribaculaceae bacterium]|nr:transcription antitermination protein NusB [Muribaculaceae bacterium]
MINRVLIRIKVVQMLYSYLLTRSEFRIPSIPDNPSRDKKYAFALYHDLLLLLPQLSGQRVQPAGSPDPMAGVGENRYLFTNKMIRALMSDDTVRSIMMRHGARLSRYNTVVPVLYDAIVKSSAYRSYIRMKNREVKDDVDLWKAVLLSIIAKSPEFMAAVRSDADFTHAGFEQAIGLMEETMDSFSDNRTRLIEARRSLTRSLDKAYELYHSMLLLCVELTRMQAQRVDAAKHKHLPTAEDLNPNTRFVDNRLPQLLEQSEDMKQYLKENPISWNDNPTLLRRLLDRITESDIYAEYMAQDSTDLQADCDFWRAVYKNIIFPSDDLAEALESMSVYWNDDLTVMDSFVLKTIKRIAADGGTRVKLLPKYKDEEDARFGAELFSKAVENREKYHALIDKFVNTDQWDSERLAFMDIVIMITAIAELLGFPAIPIPVTLNEYIEIANCYSTPRSGQFINGILYSVINYLKSEGELLK